MAKKMKLTALVSLCGTVILTVLYEKPLTGWRSHLPLPLERLPTTSSCGCWWDAHFRQ